MASANPAISRLGARIGGTAKHSVDDPRLPELRRDLRVERAAEHIARLVAEAPPPTADQLARLRTLLTPPATPERQAVA